MIASIIERRIPNIRQRNAFYDLIITGGAFLWGVGFSRYGYSLLKEAEKLQSTSLYLLMSGERGGLDKLNSAFLTLEQSGLQSFLVGLEIIAFALIPFGVMFYNLEKNAFESQLNRGSR